MRCMIWVEIGTRRTHLFYSVIQISALRSRRNSLHWMIHDTRQVRFWSTMKTFQTIFHHYRQMQKTLELVRYSQSIWSTNRGNRIIQITTQKQLARIAIKGIEGHLKSTSITTKGILWEFFSLRLIHKRYRYMNQTCQCETLPQQC